MATTTTSKGVRDITRLPEAPKPQIKTWQKLPTRPKTEITPLEVASFKTPKGTTGRRSKSAHATPGVTPKDRTTPKVKPGTTPSSVTSGCRFIPKRTGNDEYSSHLLLKKDVPKKELASDDDISDNGDPPNESYRNSLLSVSCNGNIPTNVLSFKNVTPASRQDSCQRYIRSGGISSAVSLPDTLIQQYPGQQERRKVCPDPEKILDAPNFTDDYYLNLLDWSNKNIVAVALGECIYLWNGDTGEVEQLEGVSYDDVVITSLSWADKGRFLAIGLDNGSIQLYDIDKSKKIRTMRGHIDRVGSLSWNGHILASGCRSGEIHLHDVRQQEHLIGRLLHHTMEVCGLKWSPDGCYLASGSNDNNVCIWRTLITDKPVHLLSGHEAAVKALAWCPWQPNLLATGGGAKDRMIKFWDTRTGELIQSINMKSPVTSICWSKPHKEFISSHGEPNYSLKIMKYPTMSKVAELKGHTERILHMCISPDKTKVITAGADETLRIWKCFKSPSETEQSVDEDSVSAMLRNAIL